MKRNSTKGFIAQGVLALVALLIIIGGAYYVKQKDAIAPESEDLTLNNPQYLSPEETFRIAEDFVVDNFAITAPKKCLDFDGIREDDFVTYSVTRLFGNTCPDKDPKASYEPLPRIRVDLVTGETFALGENNEVFTVNKDKEFKSVATTSSTTTQQKVVLKVPPQSLITVVSPNGGEEWSLDSIERISWKYKNQNIISKVDLYLFNPSTCNLASTTVPVYPECQESYITLDKNIPADTLYDWVVGTDAVNKSIPTGDYKMKICAAGTEDCDFSDHIFMITSPEGTTTSPLLLTASTSKMKYTQNEEIQINLTVQNSSDEDITLYFLSGCMTTYKVGSFNSWEGMACTADIPQITVKAKSSYSWGNSHLPSRYKIPLGTQKLTVYLTATKKDPFTGEVLKYTLPEPQGAETTIVITN